MKFKIIILLLLLPQLFYCVELDLKHELIKCSKIKNYQSRLMCYDVIAHQVKPKNELEIKGNKLTRECSHCHGGRWEMLTRVNSIPVKIMTKKQIKKALFGYKEKNYGGSMKDVMENIMKNSTKEDIDTIIEYILWQREK